MDNEQVVEGTVEAGVSESTGNLFGNQVSQESTPVETEPQTETPAVTTEAPTEPVVKVEEKKVVQKPRMLEDLQRERARRRTLENELAEIKSLIIKNSNVQDPDVKQIQDELGVDEESARKLNSVLNSKLQKLAPKPTEIYTEESAHFQEEANIVSREYRDWESNRPVMEKLFLEQAAINPSLALQRGPEYYYLKARQLGASDTDTARAEGRREIAQKINEKNVAQSGSNTPTPKPTTDSRDLGTKLREMPPAEFARRYKENPNPSQWKI